MIIDTLKTMILFWCSITISNGDLFVSDSETFYIDFTNIDEFNPPKEGALIKIEKKMIVVRTFLIVTFLVKTSMNTFINIEKHMLEILHC